MASQVFIFGISLVFMISHCFAYNKYYMNTRCGRTFDLSGSLTSGKLYLTQWHHYSFNMDCVFTLRAPQNHRLIVRILDIDIDRWFFTCNDWMQLYDGNDEHASNLTPRLCGENEPRRNFVSSGRELTVKFVSDSMKNDDGFKLLFNSFHTGSCTNSEFKCDNGRCIPSYLKCDKYDNCGDGSDFCEITMKYTIGIIFAVIAIGVIVIVVCCCIRRQRARRTGRKTEQNAVPMTTYPTQSAYPATQAAYPATQSAYPATQPAYPANQPAYQATQPGPPPQGYAYGQPGNYPPPGVPPPGYPVGYQQSVMNPPPNAPMGYPQPGMGYPAPNAEYPAPEGYPQPPAPGYPMPPVSGDSTKVPANPPPPYSEKQPM